ncbi:hypothetical protein MASR2M48_04580 [Spirochaetota bacterium]
METDRIVDIPCDDVYIAVGEKVDSATLSAKDIKTAKDGRFMADKLTGKTTGNVWAIGDAVTGPATAAEAMGLGKHVAKAIDEELMKRHAFGSLYKDFSHSMALPPEPTKTSMCHSRLVPPEERRGNFQEIALGYSGEQALLEASRCLRCDIKCRRQKPLAMSGGNTMNATLTKTINFTIDGREVSVAAGTTILDACRASGVRIPTLCHLEGVSSNASCGLCVVEVEGAKSLIRSCVQAAAPGMKIQTSSARVMEARRTSHRAPLGQSPGGLPFLPTQWQLRTAIYGRADRRPQEDIPKNKEGDSAGSCRLGRHA